MHNRSVCISPLLAVVLAMPALSHAQTIPPRKPCDEIVTTVYPGWLSRVPRQTLRRVEIRNCRVRDFGILQIVAWREGANVPDLVEDTDRFSIVKVAMSGDVFVLETAGASSNVVQVVLYENGIPRLAIAFERSHFHLR